MHYNQTYRRETPRQIAERIRLGQPGTPVFSSSTNGEGKHLSTLDELARRKQIA